MIRTILTLVGSVLVTAFLISLVIYVAKVLDYDSEILKILAQTKGAGAYGLIVFMIVLVLFVVFILPSAVLTIGAGALYGPVVGAIVVVLAETIGATIAFYLARLVFRGRTEAFIQKREKVYRAISVVKPGDWFFISLLRMIPFFPFKVSNYCIGITSIDVRSYLIGTFIGLWPITVFNVYLGAIATNYLEHGEVINPDSTQYWIFYLAGTLIALTTITLATKRYREVSSPDHSSLSTGES